MLLLSANLGGAHSLLPENRGARSVGLQAEVLQHEGSKLSAWTQLFDISHGFEMLHSRCFQWLTSENGTTVEKQDLRMSRRNFQVEKKEKRKFSHAAVIICLDICSNPDWKTPFIFRDVYSTELERQFSQIVCKILKNVQGVRARLVST